MASERNDMTTLEPKSGLRPIPTMPVREAHNSTPGGLRSPALAAETDSQRIFFAGEKVRDLAVKMKSTPRVHQSPVHFLMVIHQLTRARANRFRAGRQEQGIGWNATASAAHERLVQDEDSKSPEPCFCHMEVADDEASGQSILG
jgi:hypothetical protein